MSHNYHLFGVRGAVPEQGSEDAQPEVYQREPNIIRHHRSRDVSPKSWHAKSTGSWSFKVPERGFYVYVAWGFRTRRPLYVGVSGQLFNRLGRHIFEREWGIKVRRFDFWAFATQEDAARAELEAIIELNPIHNIRRFRPSFQGISDEQAEIIRRVQNREKGE